MLRVDNLYKQYRTDTGTVEALKGVSFEVQSGEIYTLLGPSGCGKSTTLRAVAGLETASDGEITIGDTVVFSGARNINLMPEKRGIGMVFQSYAIWPHMTVYKNVAFPLVHGNHGIPKREIRDRVMRALELVQLETMAERPAPMLSGGQQQRVALARALVYEPKILLLDEPLSNLDAKLRVEMRIEIQRIIKRLGLTGLYVTHDQEEAMAISDRIAVMKDGLILQEAEPHEIYVAPVNLFVAGFIGRSSVLEGMVTQVAGDRLQVASGPVTLWCPARFAPAGVRTGDILDVVMRPEDILLGEIDPGTVGANTFEARIESAIFTGGHTTVELSIAGMRIVSERQGEHRLSPGSIIKVGVAPEQVRTFARPSAT